MPEVIADLPYSIVDAQGREFYVSVAGEARADGVWEGWLEYLPLDESDALLTPTETTQSSREALQSWADTLTEVYVQGAYQRTVTVKADARRRIVARRDPITVERSSPADLPDPFQLFRAGRDMMRTHLGGYPRGVLLDIIAAFDLNPANKSLRWLNDRQLVTFIVTATEAQMLLRRA